MTSRIRDYRILRMIGKGSFGKVSVMNNQARLMLCSQVYLVKHEIERKHYVMKVIKLRGIPKKERLAAAVLVSRCIKLLISEACRNEVMLMQKLAHPNIVGYKESFFAKGRDQLCIVMTYCDGGDLASRVKSAHNRLFKEDQILHWFVQVSSIFSAGLRFTFVP